MSEEDQDVMGRRGHVVPVNDRQPHEASMACWCHPLHLHGGTVVHNAADCRERFERQDGREYDDGRWTLVYQAAK